jgi:hypothetical protein
MSGPGVAPLPGPLTIWRSLWRSRTDPIACYRSSPASLGRLDWRSRNAVVNARKKDGSNLTLDPRKPEDPKDDIIIYRTPPAVPLLRLDRCATRRKTTGTTQAISGIGSPYVCRSQRPTQQTVAARSSGRSPRIGARSPRSPSLRRCSTMCRAPKEPGWLLQYGRYPNGRG